jgi:hypothetical protein
MSQTEFHTGKLYPVKIENNLEETCRSIASRHNIELGEDWQEDFIDVFNAYEYKRKKVTEEYFIHVEKLYRVIDHEEREDEEYFMKLDRNPDGSISFIGQFYNGGTCFSEMLEDALGGLKPSYQKQIKEIIEEICATHVVDMPTSIPGAAKMIATYKGIEKAIELYEGAAKEMKHDIFKSSAYEATLETILKNFKPDQNE